MTSSTAATTPAAPRSTLSQTCLTPMVTQQCHNCFEPPVQGFAHLDPPRSGNKKHKHKHEKS
jgi:hypothetical protein